MASNFHQPSTQPKAQSEVLKYGERIPGGVSRAHGSVRGKEMERSTEETLRLKQDLMEIFPGQESVVTMTIQCYPDLTDINQISFFILEQMSSED